jgi:hypothetical protein
MTKSELKKIIKEVLSETQFLNEGLPIGKSKEAQDAAQKLNFIIGRINRPDLQKKARIHAADIINLIDADLDPSTPF